MGNLLEQRNPTCDIRYYNGGQWACKHMWALLDADQEIPWADQPMVFHHKWRFHVQPYDEQYHTPLALGENRGAALLIGSPWEYDVPRCATGVPGCSQEDGMWLHTINGTRFDEPGFISIPDCEWGSSEYGLEAPIDLDQVPLHVVKTANATEGHYGEMSGGQSWVLFNDPKSMVI